MKDDNSVDLLERELITPQLASSLVAAFNAAYGLAQSTANDVSFLGGELKSQILPHLRNWAVEFELNRRSRLGLLPFDSSFVVNKKKNHKHIELINDQFVLTVSQVHKCNMVPREAIFRNDRCLDGQIALDMFEPDVYDNSSEKIYAILTHGWQTPVPSFILCGIPSPNMNFWAQHVNVMELAQRITVVDDSPITDDIAMEYREKMKELTSEA